MACGTADCLIWEILDSSHCSFRAKADTVNFCRNPENVTGLCNRKSCPLSNSQYGTCRLIKGKVVLHTKTAERAHMPSKLWDKVELPEDVEAGNKIIEQEMQYWDDWQIEKVKVRYVRLLEVLNNMRRVRVEEKNVKILPIKKKLERRNKAREERALNVAHVEYTVKEELKRKLKDGEYGTIYNIQEEEFNEALDDIEQPVEFVDESDFEEVAEEEELLEKAE